MKKIFTILGIIAVSATNAQIIINEVYGGGGNSGATYTNDFVELINKGATSLTLTGAYLQYASVSGTFGANNKLELPAITLNPGQKYLIQLATGAGGTQALPNPDFVPSGTTAPNAPLALSGSGGKIALTSSSTSPTSATDSNVLDFVGWGSANQYEGTAAAPGTTNSTSISRTNAIDTNNNGADFTTGAPTPESSSGTLAVTDISEEKERLVKNSFIKNDEITFGARTKDVKIYNMFGQVVKKASVKENEALNIAELAKGSYIVTGTVNNQPVSQKILKD
ncbi:lamin tail domain-containing protein [Chryseobacterium gossypii]|uniref:lamin tail domain-containing protein n=1 Tax=Chryseobacterium gossypii TaxID=3231602 RepID=UPI0035243783